MLAKVRDLVTSLISVKTSTPSTTALQMSSRPWLKTAIADGTDPACRGPCRPFDWCSGPPADWFTLKEV
jgi:hypothetical protein